jgi:pimeloyl-ACP methyl ester carboxylesterase
MVRERRDQKFVIDPRNVLKQQATETPPSRRKFMPASEPNSMNDAAEKAKTMFVLVHGAWHGAWTYEKVIPLLAAEGYAAVARDLPAHGLNAKFPASYNQRPLDPVAFATEASPAAAVTLDNYVDSVVATIDQVRAGGFDRIILVGHSMGGLAITAAAERVPEKISKLIYLAAFMPASGVSGNSYVHSAENAGAGVRALIMADPTVVGALRIDHHSADASYRASAKQTFYGDVDQIQFDAVAKLLTPDVPLAPFATRIVTTEARWGTVPRHYIKCLQDNAIKPTLQQRFISEADAFVPGNKTRVHVLDTSHSPFMSAPEELARLLADIAEC